MEQPASRTLDLRPAPDRTLKARPAWVAPVAYVTAVLGVATGLVFGAKRLCEAWWDGASGWGTMSPVGTPDTSPICWCRILTLGLSGGTR